MEIELIGVPFDGYGRDGHQARAPQVLREAGVVRALAPNRVHDAGDRELPGFETARGPRTGLLNEPALLAMTDQLNARVRTAVGGGRLPVVIGGDCSLLLGAFTGFAEAIGRPGLLFVDGHEDTMPLDVVEDGEAANCEIGLLLGITGRLLSGDLAGRLPALDPDSLAVLGQRDSDWRRRFNVGALKDLGAWSQDLEQMRHTPAEAGRAAATRLRQTTARWWLHVDLDVLDPEVFGAQGLPDFPDQPDGLDGEQLAAALTAAVAAGGCAGVSMTIYDPDQDHDRTDAELVVRLLGQTVHAHV